MAVDTTETPAVGEEATEPAGREKSGSLTDMLTNMVCCSTESKTMDAPEPESIDGDVPEIEEAEETEVWTRKGKEEPEPAPATAGAGGAGTGRRGLRPGPRGVARGGVLGISVGHAVER